MTEPHTNLRSERVQEAIDAAGPDLPTRLLISEAHLHTTSERVTERDIYRQEVLSDEQYRIKALDLAVFVSRQDYSTKPVEQVIKEADLFYAYITEGTVPEKEQDA